MVKSEPTRTFSIFLMEGRGAAVVLLHKLNHHFAPLAIGRTVTECVFDAPAGCGAELDVIRHEIGAGPEKLLMMQGCNTHIGNE